MKHLPKKASLPLLGTNWDSVPAGENVITAARDFFSRAQEALDRTTPCAELAEREWEERSAQLGQAHRDLQACDERLRAVGYRLEERNELIVKLQAGAKADQARKMSLDLAMAKTLRSACQASSSRWMESPRQSQPLEVDPAWSPRGCLKRREPMVDAFAFE